MGRNSIRGRAVLVSVALCLFADHACGQDLHWTAESPKDTIVYGVQWAPDGVSALVLRGAKAGGPLSLWRLGRDGKGEEKVVDFPEGLELVDFRLRPGSKSEFLFAGCDAKGVCEIWSGNLDKSPPHVLRATKEQEGAVVPAPDGKRLLYVTGVAESEKGFKGDLWVSDIDGGNPKKMASSLTLGLSSAAQDAARPGWGHTFPVPPAWSPDGKRIAFVSADEFGMYRLHLLTLDDGTDKVITPTEIEACRASWSPDGRWLSYTVWDKMGGEIWLAHSDGSGAVPFAARRYMPKEPCWSPDSRSILVPGVMLNGRDGVACFAVPVQPDLAAPRLPVDGAVEHKGSFCVSWLQAPAEDRQMELMKIPVYRCSADGARRQEVAKNTAQVVSRPGAEGLSYLAFGESGMAEGEIRWTSGAGADDVLHTFKEENLTHAWAFSPDGKVLAVLARDGLYFSKGSKLELFRDSAVDPEAEERSEDEEPDGGGCMKLMVGCQLRWFPDRDEVLYQFPAERLRGVYRFAPGGKPVALGKGWPDAWPLKGGEVLVVGAPGGAKDKEGYGLYRLSTDGKPTLVSKLEEGGAEIAGVTPDGNRAWLLWSRAPVAGLDERGEWPEKTGAVLTVDLKSGKVEAFTDAAAIAASLSPDGKRLLVFEAYPHLKYCNQQARGEEDIPGAIVLYEVESRKSRVIVPDAVAGAMIWMGMFGMPVRPFDWAR